MARKLPEVPKLARKVDGPVFLVWEESANERHGGAVEVRATYATFEEAMLQAFGDRRPGRLEICPTCGTHVAGAPTGHGLVELGYNVLRVEDSNGEVLWDASQKGRQRKTTAK